MDMFRKFLIIFIGLTFSLKIIAGTSVSNDPKILEVRTGDVILLPLDCFSCRMIADEEETIYSHSGVAIVDNEGEIFVAEALGSVKMVPLKVFLARVPLDKNAALYRTHELDQLYMLGLEEFDRFEEYAQTLFISEYAGLPFDHDYLWDNKNEEGKQKLYCSEFVAKFLNHFLRVEMTPYPMDFTKNWDFWVRYFNGNVPQGKPGNSPGSIARSNLFYQVRIFQ